MLKSLMLSILSVVGVGAPVVYTGGVTEVTYVAETNEVNTIDDLVVGNIYTLDFENYLSSSDKILFNTSYVHLHDYNNTYVSMYNDYENDYLRFRLNTNNVIIALYNSSGSSNLFNMAKVNLKDYHVDFIYTGDYFGQIDEISRCENIPVLSVSHQDNQGLFNVLTEFINTNIFTGGVMDSVNFEVLGSVFTLGSYLSLITTIIILGLIIYLLIRLVYWVGCLFTKSFRGR